MKLTCSIINGSEIAKNKLKEKLDILAISRMTGLDVDTLEKLSHEIK
jgi:hypothetical protein